MPIYKKEDLRIVKTQKAFLNAMTVVLERRKFRQITVNDLCEEALTSRAAFYTHFKDKYNLLENWFSSRLTQSGTSGIIDIINQLICKDYKAMRSILYEADNETIEILHNFIRSLINVFLKKTEKTDQEYAVLSTFCVGGIFEIIKYQINQEDMQKHQSISNCFNDLLKKFLDLYS